ncbi:MAG: hypothetical protein JSS61_02945 [Verrucomicrobia bacterium]|nr:hypothetical protein [Verrucomicrobiota bacterium]
MSSKNLLQKMDWEPGYRVSALATPKEHFSLEAVFFYLQPWVGEKHVNGDAKLRLGFVPADYTEDYRDASLAKGRYHSQFWDAEFNYWRNYSPRLADYFAFSLIFGARYFHLNESLKLKFVRPPDSSDYKIHTYNHIYALQVGFDLQINPVDWLTWDIVAKVGPLATCGKQRTHLRDENNTVTLRHYEREKWQSGIFTDVSASMGFQIKDILNLHVGYEMLFLSGIALPPNQVFKEADAGKKVEVNGTAIIHGVFAGATLSF